MRKLATEPLWPKTCNLSGTSSISSGKRKNKQQVICASFLYIANVLNIVKNPPASWGHPRVDFFLKTVVMITYIFPPEGHAGMYGLRRLVCHLSRVGWKAKGIAVIPSRYERYDLALLYMAPSETRSYSRQGL